MENPHGPRCRDAAVGREPPARLRLPAARVAPVNWTANRWTALIFSTDGRIPLPKFWSAAPVTSRSSPRGSLSADSCCGPIPGSRGVSLQWTQDKSVAQASSYCNRLCAERVDGTFPSQTCTPRQCTNTRMIAHSLNEVIF